MERDAMTTYLLTFENEYAKVKLLSDWSHEARGRVSGIMKNFDLDRYRD